jgi:hypothetical protein
MRISLIFLFFTACEESTTDHTDEIETLRKELEELRSEIQDNKIKIDELELQLSFAKDDISYLQENSGTDENLTDHIDTILQHDALLQNLENQVQNNSDSIQDILADVAPIVNSGLVNLSDYMSVDTTQQIIEISGANLLIHNGSNATHILNGLGNLIIGYNISNSDIRTGSHNVIIGDHHSYTSSGSLLVGENHRAEGKGIALVGGTDNVVSADFGSIAGGQSSIISSSNHHFVGGGFGAQINDGYHNAILGGIDPTIASGSYNIVIGGESNTIIGAYDSIIVGGDGNQIENYDYVSLFGQFSSEASLHEQVLSD